MWQFSAIDPDRSRIEREDPLRANVTCPAAGDELTVTIDDSLSVVETAVE